jgi:hypothetical protein
VPIGVPSLVRAALLPLQTLDELKDTRDHATMQLPAYVHGADRRAPRSGRRADRPDAARRRSADRSQELLAGLFAAATGLGADAAVLVHVRVALAFVAAVGPRLAAAPAISRAGPAGRRGQARLPGHPPTWC